MVYWNSTMKMLPYLESFQRYVLTDPDISFSLDVPDNWLQHFWEMMDRQGALKVGAAYRIDDLPDHYLARNQVWQYECDAWRADLAVQGERDAFWAPIDSWLALWHTKIIKNQLLTYPSIRMGGPYQVKHLRWYEEERWLAPDILYQRRHKERGHTFGWWGRAVSLARRGKQLLDFENVGHAFFSRHINETFFFPAGVQYLGFCSRFSHGIRAIPSVKPPQCLQV
eukprot:TRINITY_DN18922_c0_g1_i2.p1 TRINITY_DN18922_c0_g1~~TRINITY_DN18922_c0_g1_i2.p1  ORF type:complete len:225 (-),score=22.79 TRINITY_DN18922_c0_g1_i2:115-789(-)